MLDHKMKKILKRLKKFEDGINLSVDNQDIVDALIYLLEKQEHKERNHHEPDKLI